LQRLVLFCDSHFEDCFFKNISFWASKVIFYMFISKINTRQTNKRQ
jgi:hypothetical protein